MPVQITAGDAFLPGLSLLHVDPTNSHSRTFLSRLSHQALPGCPILCAKRRPLPLFDAHAIHPLSFLVFDWHVLSQGINSWLDGMESVLPPSGMDPLQPLSIYRSLRWMHENLDDGDVTQWIWHCLWETAHAPHDFHGEDAKKRGFAHVIGDKYHVPQSGMRALALIYLTGTQSHWPFIVEAYIQNLSIMDVDSAVHLTVWMHQNLGLPGLDSEQTVAILRAASAYGRSHAQQPIGDLLLSLAQLAECIFDPQLRRLHLGYTTLLYSAWLSVQPVPHQPSTVRSYEAIVWYTCLLLGTDPEQYHTHPERLHQWIGVQEVAELLSIYAQSHEDPAAALAAGMHPDDQEGMRAIVGALLEMARLRQDSAAAAGNRALVLDTAPSPPPPHADPPPGPALSLAQSQARVTDGRPSYTPSPTRRSVRSTLSHAQPQDPQPSRSPELGESVLGGMEGERHGVSGRPGLRGSPALRADAVHAPSDERVQTRHNVDAVHCGDEEGDREAGGTDAALSAGAEADSEGAPGDSGSHGSASLRAVIIHSPSDAVAHAAVRRGAETDPGEDQGSRRDDRGMDAPALQN